jgi:hypothetical protein
MQQWDAIFSSHEQCLNGCLPLRELLLGVGWFLDVVGCVH